ncbi:MAG TPA: hypothetical protein VHV47_00600 [Opitutaceae bacterium]|nr:hypothetical protein [Opitutaceae bacterium]
MADDALTAPVRGAGLPLGPAAAAAVAAAALWLLATAPRRQLFAVLLAVLGLFLGLQAVRNLPLLVFCSGPLLAAAWRPAGARIAAERLARLGTVAASAALAVWIAAGGCYRSFHSPAAFGPGESRAAYPVGFAEYLRSRGFTGTIFNRAADGGYLEFHFPGLRLFGDTRFTDAALVREYFRATTEPAVFHEVNRRYGFEAALLDVAESRGLAESLLREPRWRLAYADLHRAFLVDARTPAGAAAALVAPVFYGGEDLAEARERAAALQWIALLEATGDRADLLRLLGQFGRAPRVPSAAIELALDYGLKTGDADVIAAARALRPRLVASSPDGAATVDWLLGRFPP